MLFWSFIFPETYICYRVYFNLSCYLGKKVQKNFSFGLKNLVKLGAGIINSKISRVGRSCFFRLKLQVLGWFLTAQPSNGRQSRPTS